MNNYQQSRKLISLRFSQIFKTILSALLINLTGLRHVYFLSFYTSPSYPEMCPKLS